jgi:Zn-dependent protease
MITMFSNISPGDVVIIVATLLVSLGLHEAMHALVAHELGDDTAEKEGRLTLNPLRHIDLLTTIALPTILLLAGYPPILAAKPVPFNPYKVRFGEYGAALVGLAGPLTNLALAGVGALFVNAGVFTGEVLTIVQIFILINVGIFVFNMIPLPPLDGSRLLYAVAPEPVQRVMERIEQLGLIVVLMAFLLLSPVVGPFLSTIDQAIYNFLLR